MPAPGRPIARWSQADAHALLSVFATTTATQGSKRARKALRCRMLVARRPAPPLDRAVELIWSVQTTAGPRRLERVLPTGCAQVVINLAEDRTRAYDETRGLACSTTEGSLLCGPRSRYDIIDTDEQYDVVGASLAPGGLRHLFDLHAQEVADRDVPLSLLIGASAVDRLRTRLQDAPDQVSRLDVLEQALREVGRRHVAHAVVLHALQALTTRPEATRVRDVVAASGYSARYLIDRFTADVGLTPKVYCRVRRFQLALARTDAGRPDDWATLALDCGFSDQSHLVREFRAFAGVPPRDYLDRRTPYRNHVTFLQDAPRLDA